jgi:Tfp pilus assembly protein PilN
VAAVWLAGDRPRAAELHELGQQLDLPIDFIDCHDVLPQPPETFAPWAFPLAGLALDAAHRRAPLVDLVHPHRAITTQGNRRTYVLLATALACLLAWATWLGYQNLRLPQQAAAAANRQAALLQERGDTDRTDQQLAAALGRWSAGQVDLLDQLRRLSINLRPSSFDAEDFSASEDLVLMALNMQRQTFDLDAVATNRDAVGAFEARLRADHYLVQRDNTNQKSALENYNWPFRVIVQLPGQSAAPQGGTRP